MHYKEFNVWLETLKNLSESEWHKPIGEGKWSVSAVISHLLFWDQYSIEERFPFFQEGAKLSNFPDFQEKNDEAKKYAESGVSKEKVINDLILLRKQYFQLIEGYTEDNLAISFFIGDQLLTIRDYFEDFVSHDRHHRQQIEKVIVK